MAFDGLARNHVEMEVLHPNGGQSRGSIGDEMKEKIPKNRHKRHKKERARVNDGAHTDDNNQYLIENPDTAMDVHHDTQNHELHGFSRGRGKCNHMARKLDTESDSGAPPESSQMRQPSEDSSDSGKGGNDVDQDDAEELENIDASEYEELMAAYRPPPSHQISSGEREYSPDEAEASDSPVNQTVQEATSGDDGPGQKSRPRKRKSPADAQSCSSFRPLKKAKGSINRAYLEILNEDIDHAASQYVALGRETEDERISLPASQIGTVTWTSMEKERFFEALGRLGRDDSPGIARRIRTKGVMEVRQYLTLLQDGLDQRQRQNKLNPMELADFPAAVELSHECCEALDEVADSLALRQEKFEQTTEQYKRGPDWLITQEKCRDDIQDETADDELTPLSVLNVPRWLQVSERLFMNGTSEESNWQSLEGDYPSIRHATLDGFHSLALTLTRRLVASSLYLASSRIRSEQGYNADVKSEVRRKDVCAAALSLGLRMDKRQLLSGCARRLGLHVYEEPPRLGEDEDRATMMPYDAVEHSLGKDGYRNIRSSRHQVQRMELSSDEETVSRRARPHSEVQSDSMDSEDDSPSDEYYEEYEEGEDGNEEVKSEADEIMLYSAVDQPQTKRDRETLFRRIKAEREQESRADSVDAQATYQEERRMWEVLGRNPRQPLVDPGLPPCGRRMKASAGATYSVGKNWRAHTKVASEWETRSRLHG